MHTIDATTFVPEPKRRSKALLRALGGEKARNLVKCVQI